MNRLNGRLLGSALWFAVLGAGVAIAIADVWDPDDNSFATQNELVHGSVQVHELGPGGDGDPGGRDQDYFRIGQRPLASYEVVVDGTSNQVSGLTGGLALERYQGTAFVQSSAPTDPGIQDSRSLRWENNTNTNLSDAYIRVAAGPCVSCASSKAAFHIRAYETTYSIARFNNSASQVTVLTITNTGSDTVTGHAHFWAANQTLLGSLAFSLGPKQTLLQITSALAYAAGQGGSITVANDGRYGDLNGKAVAVEPNTGFTFDTPLVARAR